MNIPVADKSNFIKTERFSANNGAVKTAAGNDCDEYLLDDRY